MEYHVYAAGEKWIIKTCTPIGRVECHGCGLDMGGKEFNDWKQARNLPLGGVTFFLFCKECEYEPTASLYDVAQSLRDRGQRK